MQGRTSKSRVALEMSGGEKEKMKTAKLVFCHLEFLRSSSSPDLHLTQLAAVSADDDSPVFLPVVPPV